MKTNFLIYSFFLALSASGISSGGGKSSAFAEVISQESLDSQFVEAVLTEDVDLVRTLLKRGANINITTVSRGEERSILSGLFYEEKEDILFALLCWEKIDLEFHNKHLPSGILSEAMDSCCSINIFNILLESGLDPNGLEGTQKPIFHAIEDRFLYLAPLLDAGASLEAKYHFEDEHFGIDEEVTPLEYARKCVDLTARPDYDGFSTGEEVVIMLERFLQQCKYKALCDVRQKQKVVRAFILVVNRKEFVTCLGVNICIINMFAGLDRVAQARYKIRALKLQAKVSDPISDEEARKRDEENDSLFDELVASVSNPRKRKRGDGGEKGGARKLANKSSSSSKERTLNDPILSLLKEGDWIIKPTSGSGFNCLIHAVALSLGVNTTEEQRQEVRLEWMEEYPGKEFLPNDQTVLHRILLSLGIQPHEVALYFYSEEGGLDTDTWNPFEASRAIYVYCSQGHFESLLPPADSLDFW